VVDSGEADLLRVDSIVLFGIVSEESVGDVDSARDGTVSGKLGLHLISSSDTVVVADVVSGVLDSPAFVLASFASRAWRPCAVLAGGDRANLFLEVVGGVLFARSSHESSVVSVLVDLSGVTSIARATSLSVDNDLSVNGDGSGGGELVHDVESVSDGGGSSLSPARSTVAGDVLVFAP